VNRRLLLLTLFIALPAAAAAPHEWAVAYQNVEARGARAVFNVWNPYVEQPGEFSLAQLWLIAGTPKGQQTLEVGWHVFPNLYGDTKTHLFLYDGECYNLQCGHFVQTNFDVVLGGPLSCTSVDGGPQCEIALEFARADSGDWWLKVDGAWVGYYPASRFDSAGLGRNAVTIEAGGEIVNQSAGGLHTTTNMGSGRAPSDGYGHAAYVRAIQYADMSGAWHNATSLTTTTPGHYQTAWIDGMFFFGGPGRVQSETTLRSASTSAATVAAPSTLTVAFTIDATLDDDVIVGAALANLGLMPDDRRVSLKSGSNAAVRSFAVPANLAAGAYDLTATLWRDRNRNGVIDNNDPILGTLTYPGAITVAPARRRASR
jgi:Neprosin